MRLTPKKISTLKENEVYVFGSNQSGIHGKGSAKIAAERFGAKAGIGFGLEGQSFAIPTKNKKIKTLELVQIKYFVDKFIEFAKRRSDLTFYVVEIGCMNAGYEPSNIAPMFKEAKEIENIYLPERFWNVLNLI
jgi:hypothetical protein